MWERYCPLGSKYDESCDYEIIEGDDYKDTKAGIFYFQPKLDASSNFDEADISPRSNASGHGAKVRVDNEVEQKAKRTRYHPHCPERVSGPVRRDGQDDDVNRLALHDEDELCIEYDTDAEDDTRYDPISDIGGRRLNSLAALYTPT